MWSVAVSDPRIVVRGATTMVSRRTTLRKAFLGPWHPMVQDIWLYALAYAQQQCDVAIHHTTLLPNHHHTHVTPTKDNLPKFLALLHRDVSCAVHTLLCEQRYDAPRELFDDRQTHCMRLVDAAAQASGLVYGDVNTVAAGLVARPEHMPGRHIGFSDWKHGEVTVARPPLYFDRRKRPAELQLHLTPSALLYDAFGGDLPRLVYHMERLSDGACSALRAVRKRPALGARALTRLHPWSEPRTMREPGGRRVPTFRIGARGIVGTQQRIGAAVETHHFRARHRDARVARRDRGVEAIFPFGTYAQRVHHGAAVEPEPPDDAIVTRPGPLLCEVKAELATRADRVKLAQETSSLVLQEVRDAFVAEAADIVDQEQADLAPPNRPPEPSPEAAFNERAPAVVRHRLAPRRDEEPAKAACRLITLRDRRRGRPPRTARHGSDPPN